MLRPLSAVLLASGVALHVSHDTSRTFYVSPSGSDSAVGSSTHPWLTLHHAAVAAPSGSKVTVRAGHYADVFASYHRLSWIAGGQVTVTGQISTEAPTTFTGFHFNGGNKRPYSLQLLKGGTITRCSFTGGTEGLVEGEGAVTISHSTFAAPAGTTATVMLQLVKPTRLSVSSNTFTENKTGLDDTIDVLADGTRAQSITISGNTIRTHAQSGHVIAVGTETHSASDGDLNGAMVRGNTITGPYAFHPNLNKLVTTHAVFVGYNWNATVAGNTVTGEGYGVVLKGAGQMYTSGGISKNTFTNDKGVTGVLVKGVKGVAITGNTFHTDGSKGWPSILAILVETNPESNNAAGSATVEHNSITGIGTGPLFTVEDTTHLQSDNNTICQGVAGPVGKVGSMEYTPAEWQAAGYDVHSTFTVGCS